MQDFRHEICPRFTAFAPITQSILEQDAFILGFPNVTQVKEADYLGVESGYNTDKLKNIGFHTSEAEKVYAPIIDEFLLSLECQVVHKVTLGSHMQITGEVKKIIADESILNEQGKVILEKLKPIIYDEEQFRYLEVGKTVSEAFKPGAAMKKSFTDK